MHVLRGRVRLVAGEDTWEGRQDDLVIVPQRPHRLDALEDAAVLLTVAKTRAEAPGAQEGTLPDRGRHDV